MQKFLCLMGVVLSMFFSVSMESMVGVWSMMEVNTLMFIPLLAVSKEGMNYLSSVKYFIIQSMGSLLIISGLMMKGFSNWSLLITLGALWKLGSAPFHFWFFYLSLLTSWDQFYLLSTTQKVIPFMFLEENLSYLLIITALASMLISNLMCYFQVNFKKVLMASSLFNLSWGVISLMMMKNLWVMFMLLYSILAAPVILMFMKNSLLNHESEEISVSSMIYSKTILMYMISLGGLPPFGMFYVKLMIIYMMLVYNYFMLGLYILMSSVFMIYMYMHSSLGVMMMSSKFWFYTNNKNMSFHTYLMLILTMIFSPLFSLYLYMLKKNFDFLMP